MCGICGFVGKVESQGIVLESMMQALYQCEDGDLGEYYWENGAMASRQEEIAEIEGCYQPRVSEDGRLVLVCDGVISNTQSLQRRLEDSGHVFRRGGDKEVILHAFEEYGEDMVNYLEGSYALVIWNREEERLFAARDAKGGPPLYYVLTGGRLAFATSMESILAFVRFQGKAAMASSERGERPGQAKELLEKKICLLEAGQDLRYEKNLLKLQCYCPPQIEMREEPQEAAKEKSKEEKNPPADSAGRRRLFWHFFQGWRLRF